MKKYRFLFLMVFLIVGLLFIPNAVNADSIEIGEVVVDFDGAVPVVGEAPKDIVINSNEYEIVFQQWYEYESGQAVTTFEYGKTYYFNIYIKEKAGYEFVSPVITTKNIAWDDDYGRLIVTNPDHSYYGCVYITGDYTTGTVHADVEIEGTTNIIPVVGGTPQYLAISSDEYEVLSQVWYDENLNLVSTFEKGKLYYYILVLKHKTAKRWDITSTLNVTNIDWTVTFSVSDLSDDTLKFGGGIYPIEVEKTYKITFDANGGELKDTSKTLSFDSWYYTDLPNLEEPTREGYKFKGWYTKVEGGIPLAAEPTLTDGMTFYAQWEKVSSTGTVDGNSSEPENPNTFDGIGSSILMGTISLIGLVGATIYLKRRNKVRAN